MSDIKKCDRCGKLPLQAYTRLIVDPEPTVWIDLCDACNTEFIDFMREKGSKIFEKHSIQPIMGGIINRNWDKFT